MRTSDTRWPQDKKQRCVFRASADLLYFADAIRGMLRLERLYTAPPATKKGGWREDAEHRDMVRFDVPTHSDWSDGLGL